MKHDIPISWQSHYGTFMLHVFMQVWYSCFLLRSCLIQIQFSLGNRKHEPKACHGVHPEVTCDAMWRHVTPRLGFPNHHSKASTIGTFQPLLPVVADVHQGDPILCDVQGPLPAAVLPPNMLQWEERQREEQIFRLYIIYTTIHYVYKTSCSAHIYIISSYHIPLYESIKKINERITVSYDWICQSWRTMRS